MKIPLAGKVSSFLHQLSLAHQLSRMKSEMEALAREEARFIEVSGRTIALLSARQERGGRRLPPSSQRYT